MVTDGEEACILQTNKDPHSVNHTSSTFPLHLDLAWFNPLAELAEGSTCFVHVAEHYKSLPGDVLTSQGFLYLIAQGRRIGHILVVLWDLPTQDHMAAVVHLAIRRRLEVSVREMRNTHCWRSGGSTSESAGTTSNFANFGKKSQQTDIFHTGSFAHW